MEDANFTPDSKSNPKNVVANYGGIALLSILFKTFEKCVNARLYSHMETILCHDQRGFKNQDRV